MTDQKDEEEIHKVKSLTGLIRLVEKEKRFSTQNAGKLSTTDNNTQGSAGVSYYYVNAENKTEGPFTAAEIQDLYTSKKISDETPLMTKNSRSSSPDATSQPQPLKDIPTLYSKCTLAANMSKGTSSPKATTTATTPKQDVGGLPPVDFSDDEPPQTSAGTTAEDLLASEKVEVLLAHNHAHAKVDTQTNEERPVAGKEKEKETNNEAKGNSDNNNNNNSKGSSSPKNATTVETTSAKSTKSEHVNESASKHTNDTTTAHKPKSGDKQPNNTTKQDKKMDDKNVSASQAQNHSTDPQKQEAPHVQSAGGCCTIL
ncbi:hypothetical protein RFI_30454 [Reticulomyxa filosa]|uniref:Uncharacterized protein n=1 Tax=Reticulomyxa filosa TaxID=46433 RepID=X6LYF5_RETFI|nr:hypothetical protein RFI_30454 [Reticulomyxa filosa]|eukprot:ETO06938.1 hypothetical protein RFI_30454 [Reticulomyxa filosa]